MGKKYYCFIAQLAKYVSPNQPVRGRYPRGFYKRGSARPGTAVLQEEIEGLGRGKARYGGTLLMHVASDVIQPVMCVAAELRLDANVSPRSLSSSPDIRESEVHLMA